MNQAQQSSAQNKPHRGTIFSETATILAHDHHDGDQCILRVAAPECARHAKPGSFAHIQCSPELPMRRPISIMRVDAKAGWVEVLYKIVGDGTRRLAQRQVGEQLEWLGPIGNGFELHDDRPRRLMIGGGVGMPPMIYLADAIRQRGDAASSLVILGSEVPFPFRAQPSPVILDSLPNDVTASMPLLDDWHIPNRLCSLQGYPGCYQGYVTDLARLWLAALDKTALNEVEIFSCGPEPMLHAVAKLAREFDLPCQVSLEEYMACAVGGCAGCVVEIRTDTGTAMKRVCVDGPVFDANTVNNFL